MSPANTQRLASVMLYWELNGYELPPLGVTWGLLYGCFMIGEL